MITKPVLFERFAGRELEFATLLEFWARCARENCGFTVVVDGEAGVGKSRLLDEFRQHVERERGVAAATTCDESVQFAYAPLIALIDALLKRRVARNAIDLAGARRRLTDPLPTSSGPHASALAQRYTAVVDALSDLAARSGALCLIIDDLQWSDASTLDLLRYLARELTAAPVLLLLAHRREDSSDPRFAAALAKIERERAYRLAILPLGEEHIRSSISETLAGVPIPANTIARIAELAEGKPYFAEELLRSVLEDTSAGTRTTVAPPTSLRAAVLQRVDALAPLDRDVLANAAVIGRTFSAALLARLLAREEAPILRSLRAARNAQIVRETPGGAYEFRHALTREILYSEFLVAETRALHTRIADELASESERASLLGEIAYHRWMARDGDRSAAASEAAGDQAAALSAYNDAVRFFERALDTVDRSSARGAALAEKVARAAIMVGDVERAQRETEAAIETLTALGDVRNGRRLTLWSARQHHLAGDRTRALEIIDATRAALANDPADEANRVAADIAFALIAGREGAPAALATAGRLLSSGIVLSDDDAYHLHHACGTAHLNVGDYEAAVGDFERAEALALRAGNAYGALYSANNRAAAAGYAGRFAIAREAYEAALARANATGIENTSTLLAANTAFWQLLLGDLEPARRNAAAAITRRASEHAVVLATSVTIRIATLTGERNAAALERAEANLARAIALDNETIVCSATGAAALALIAAGRDDEARRIVRAAADRLSEFDPAAFWLAEAALRVGDASSRTTLRNLLQASGDGSDDARAGFAAYFDAVSSGGERPRERAALAREATARFERAGLIYESARAAETAGDPARAVALFRKLGATGEIDRLEGKTEKSSERGPLASLTRREAQIAGLAARGLSNKEVAEELKIGERTVETHVANVYAKLRIRTRAELALHFSSKKSEER